MRHEVRVIFGDTDMMGVVYYANYLRYFEGARADYWRSLGRTYHDLVAWGIALPVVEAHCEYKRGAKYDDELTVKTTATLLSAVLIQFDYEILRGPDETVMATGRTVHATVNRQGRPVRLPDRVRELFT